MLGLMVGYPPTFPGVNMSKSVSTQFWRFSRLLIVPAVSAMVTMSTLGTANATDRVPAQRFTEFARVIDVQPVYKNIRVSEPRQECWIETQQHIVGYRKPRYEHHRAYGHTQRHSSSSAVVGGLVGGVIGNQLGRGHSSHSRAGATVAGVIIGSAIGNETRASDRHRPHHRPGQHQGTPIYETVEVERCREVPQSTLTQRLQHYDVTYEYRGQIFTTRTKRDPGKQIELQISISPARH